MATPVLRALKHDGYHVTYNTNERGATILRDCPYIDKMLVQKTNQVPIGQLRTFWNGLAQNFDKFVNLTGTIENDLLAIEDTALWNVSHEERHDRVGGINYVDYAMSRAGYPDRTGERPELHFSQTEHSRAKELRRKYADKFLILWSLAGSSFHKAYAHAETVALAFLDAHPDAMTMTVGDRFCKELEWHHPRAKCYSGNWGIRKSLLMTHYADVVIGTETGVLNAASCYDTPKIIMLSHSSEANLCQYWTNTTVLVPMVSCYPCHKLHTRKETCPLTADGVPICTVDIAPQTVLNSLETLYEQWQEARHGVLCASR